MSYTYKYFESTLELRKVLEPSPDLASLVKNENPLMSVVAFYSEHPIGLVKAYERGEKDLHIATVFVNLIHWRKGVGSKMLAMLEETAKEKGKDTLSLTVQTENFRAKGLYKKMGFAETGLLVMGFETWTKRIN